MKLARTRPGGFSLVEVLAALLVFSIVTLGLIPLILTSIRGTSLSRSSTVGKNVATQAMERARGLPFFISWGAQADRVDLLDLYLPDNGSIGAGTTYNAGLFTTNCPAAGAPACPTDLPSGYTLRFQAAFVKVGFVNSGGTCQETDPTPDNGTPPAEPVEDDCFIVVEPAANYDHSVSGSDSPTRQLVELTVTAVWNFQGSERTSAFTTLLADRRFGGLQAKGRAQVDYALQVLTGYRQGGNQADVITVAGTSESSVEARRVATAEQFVRSALFRMVDADDPDAPEIHRIQGASITIDAPPDVLNQTASASGQTLGVAPFANAAAFGLSNYTNVDAEVAAGQPAATGTFNFTGNSSGAGLDLWVDHTLSSDSTWQFATGASKLVSVKAGGNAFTGTSNSVVNPSGTGVSGSASLALDGLRLFPLQGSIISDASLDRSVVAIEDFSASVGCVATTDGVAADGNATASFSGTLSFWHDGNENDVQSGTYVTIPLGSAFTTPFSFGGQTISPGQDPLARIESIIESSTDNNLGLVYDSSTDANDIYLFEKSHSGHSGAHRPHLGYLLDWEMSTVTDAEDPQSGGRISHAEIHGAVTVQTNDVTHTSGGATEAEGVMQLSIGSLSCRSEDRR